MPYKNTTPTHLDNFSLFIEKLKFLSLLVIFNIIVFAEIPDDFVLSACLALRLLICFFPRDELTKTLTEKHTSTETQTLLYVFLFYFAFLLLLKYYQYHNLDWRPQYQNQNTFFFFTFYSEFLNALSYQNCCVSIASLLFELRNWTENEPKTYERL